MLIKENGRRYQEEDQLMWTVLSGEGLLENRFKFALKGRSDRKIYAYLGTPIFKYYCVEGTYIV